MNRRTFIKGTVATAAASMLPMSGCSMAPVRPGGVRIDDLLADRARIMWIAAHPDDEALIGSIMAKASLVHGCPLYFLILTHGEGGECCLPQGCEPELAVIRANEMKHAAKLYKAKLQHERYFNASLPVESFPKRHELARIWSEKKDPSKLSAEAIRRFRPDIIFTFDPHHGFTGHPEHQLTSRFAAAGVRMAADSGLDIEGLAPHRVEYFYFALNKYFPMTLLGMADPSPITETWDAKQSCINGWECRNVMARFSKAHRTQDRDMSTVRSLAWLLDTIYLCRSDPFRLIHDPFEIAV